jgi:hypothetical protein
MQTKITGRCRLGTPGQITGRCRLETPRQVTGRCRLGTRGQVTGRCRPGPVVNLQSFHTRDSSSSYKKMQTRASGQVTGRCRLGTLRQVTEIFRLGTPVKWQQTDYYIEKCHTLINTVYYSCLYISSRHIIMYIYLMVSISMQNHITCLTTNKTHTLYLSPLLG